MSRGFDNQRSPGRSRSRSRSPNRLSSSNDGQQRDYNRSSSSRNNNGNRFDDRRNNRNRSNNFNNYNGDDQRGGGNNDRLSQAVNLYSDRELGLKYRYRALWNSIRDRTLLPCFQMGEDSACLEHSLRHEMGGAEGSLPYRRFVGCVKDWCSTQLFVAHLQWVKSCTRKYSNVTVNRLAAGTRPWRYRLGKELAVLQIGRIPDDRRSETCGRQDASVRVWRSKAHCKNGKNLSHVIFTE